MGPSGPLKVEGKSKQQDDVESVIIISYLMFRLFFIWITLEICNFFVCFSYEASQITYFLAYKEHLCNRVETRLVECTFR